MPFFRTGHRADQLNKVIGSLLGHRKKSFCKNMIFNALLGRADAWDFGVRILFDFGTAKVRFYL